MTGLGLVLLLLGAAIMWAGIWHTTAQVLDDSMARLSLARWTAVYLLAIAPFAGFGGVLAWLGVEVMAP